MLGKEYDLEIKFEWKCSKLLSSVLSFGVMGQIQQLIDAWWVKTYRDTELCILCQDGVLKLYDTILYSLKMRWCGTWWRKTICEKEYLYGSYKNLWTESKLLSSSNELINKAVIIVTHDSSYMNWNWQCALVVTIISPCSSSFRKSCQNQCEIERYSMGNLTEWHMRDLFSSFASPTLNNTGI